MRIWIIHIAILFLLGCDSVEEAYIEGLWELEEVVIDGMKRSIQPTIVELSSNNSFAVSRPSGDLVGIYNLEDNTLKMRSYEKGWFNEDWTLNLYDNNILFSGSDLWYSPTKLRFRKIGEFPDLRNIENQILGKWQLYKIKSESGLELVSNTSLTIEDGHYLMATTEGIQEAGAISIDTQHRKIVFENEKETWRLWFFGKELRLNNDRLSLQYRLRRPA